MNRRQILKCAVAAGLAPLLRFLPQPDPDPFDGWSNKAADIPASIRAMRDSMASTAYPNTKIFVGAETAKILLENHPGIAKDMVVIADGVDSDGRFVPFFPEGTIVVCNDHPSA